MKKTKKKLKKFQIAGQVKNPLLADDEQDQPSYMPVDPNQANPYAINVNPYDTTVKNKHVLPMLFAGNNQNGRALGQGYHYDADGQYRKLDYTYDDNLDYTPGFKALNAGLNATTILANTINNGKQFNQEQQRYIKAAYFTPQYNQYENGLNTPPAYFMKGGKKYQIGGKTNTPVNIDDLQYIYAETQDVNKGKLITSPVYQKGGKFQVGGLFDTNKSQYVDSVLNANKNLEWVNRLYGNNQQTLQIPGEPYPSTHLMADDDNGYVFPQIQMVNGKLTYLGKNAEDYSRQNNTGIQLPKQQGTWFAANGYKEGTGVLPMANYQTPIEDIPKPSLKNVQFEKGGKAPIEIKSSHVGRFTAYAKSIGMSVQAAAHHVIANSKDPHLRKEAQFAINFSGKHQNGGVSNTGYLANSPDRFNDFNIIPSGVITMDNVNHDVMAYPDGDNPKLMKKNSGKYKFKNSKNVLEVPVHQNGGANPSAPDEVQGVDPSQANSELENGEVFTTQQGNIQKVADSEPSHNEGGSFQPNVDRVLEDTGDKRSDSDSKTLRVTSQMAQQLLGIKTDKTLTHSKLYEKAVEFYDKKLNKIQNGVKASLAQAKQSGGKPSNEALDENVKNLQNIPTRQQIFDTIYNHQEATKQINGIDNNTQGNKYGGKGKYQSGGQFSVGNNYNVNPVNGQLPYQTLTDPNLLTPLSSDYYDPNGLPYAQNVQDARNVIDGYHPGSGAFRNYYDRASKTQYTAPAGLTPAQFYTPDVVAQMGTLNAQTGIDNDLGQAEDNTWGWRHQYIYDNYYLPKLNAAKAAVTPATLNVNAAITNYRNPTATIPSKFNEPLHWYDVAGDINKYIDATSRDGVPLEQLNRQPLKVHEINPLPQIQQNQDDFNTLVKQLPQNGAGYANAANFAGKKYQINNEILGNTENLNNQAKDTVDQLNNTNQYDLDKTNLELRDQYDTRVLQGKNAQTTAKYDALDNLFNKLALNRQLNRNGQLELNMYPYFNQNAEYNGNKYALPNIPNSGAQAETPLGLTDKSAIKVDKFGRKFYTAKDPNGDTRRYLVK